MVITVTTTVDSVVGTATAPTEGDGVFETAVPATDVKDRLVLCNGMLVLCNNETMDCTVDCTELTTCAVVVVVVTTGPSGVT